MPSTMIDLKGKGKQNDSGSAAAASTAGPANASGSSSTKQATTVAEDDDDDLDELDDVLDQFNAAPASTQDTHDRAADKGSNTTSGSNGNNGEDADDDDDEDFEAIFAAELAKEMEKMMGAMGKQPAPGVGVGPGISKDEKAGAPTSNSLPGFGDEEKDLFEDKDLKEAFERIMASAKTGGDAGADDDFSMEELSKLMNGLGAGGMPELDALTSGSSSKPTSKPAASNSKAAKPQNFEDALQATMSRLADSEAQHKSRTAKGSKGSDDPLAALMAQMESLGGLPGMNGKDGEDENLPEVLDSLMDQLMSKELLHEPITELRHKYPEYLKSAEAASISSEERQRYEKQEVIVNEIYAIFEDPKYSNESQATREKVAGLMQQMQECGAPPKPLMGELGPAMALGADGMPNIDPDNCIVS